MRKLMSKQFQGILLFLLSIFAGKEENVKFFYFKFMELATQMKRPLKKKKK